MRELDRLHVRGPRRHVGDEEEDADEQPPPDRQCSGIPSKPEEWLQLRIRDVSHSIPSSIGSILAPMSGCLSFLMRLSIIMFHA